ncbi:unnamed protein product [Caenorhabditis brenneri]
MEQRVHLRKDIEFKNLAYLETRYRSIIQAEAQTNGEHIGRQPNPIGRWFGKNQRKKRANIPTNRETSDNVLRMRSQAAEETKPYKILKMSNVQNRELEKLYLSKRRNDREVQTEFGRRINLPIRNRARVERQARELPPPPRRHRRNNRRFDHYWMNEE